MIILQYGHRVHRRVGDALSAEDEAYNRRGRQFLEVLGRLHDCTWTKEDFFWLCQRKLRQLPPMEKAAFAEAPLIMEFWRERVDVADEDHDGCDTYNRRKVHALAADKERPIAKFTDSCAGVESGDGAALDDELFAGYRVRRSSARVRP